MKTLGLTTILFATMTILSTAIGNSQEKVTLKGNEVTLYGYMPKTGTEAPLFTGVNNNLQDIDLSEYKGRKVILNIFPSLDTPTCALSVRQFNQMAAELKNTTVLCISMDLPFAQKRFCSTEGIENVVPLSVFRNPEFGKEYGLLQTNGPAKGLLARAVIVVDEEGKVIYTQLVKEISQEPDYDDVMKVLK